MPTKEEKELLAKAKAEAKEAEAKAKAEAKEAEAKAKAEAKAEKQKVKVADEFFAGKKVLSKYENEGGKFVVLEGGETLKL